MRIRWEIPRAIKRDQSGIALPLAMVMVMLISVVGAGLLVFVVSDNSSAAQVNRGQQAFGMADAGVGIAQEYINKYGVPEDGTKTFQVPTEDGPVPVEVTMTQEDIGITVTSRGTAASNSERRVKAVLEANTTDGVTAPKNYYSGTDLNMNNYTEMVNGDILVEGRADITNTLKLTDGDVLVKGYGRFPNEKTITNGDFYVGGGAQFTNTTTVNNGNIYVDGGTSSLTNSTTISGGGLYIGDNASLGTSGSEWIKITGGDLYVEGNASSVGNVDISSGGNFLVGGTTSFSGTLKMSGGSFYSGGTASFQQATISNANIFINGPATFPQKVSITNSVIHANGNIRFNSSGNDLTGTSIFANGNVRFDNPSTFGTSTDNFNGDWRNSFNPTARSTAQTGIGATGTIAVASSDNATIAKGTRSFDSTPTSTKKFVATTPTGTSQITFPFSRTNPPHNALRTAAATKLEEAKADAIRRIEEGRLNNEYLDGLKQKAISQGNYREIANAGTHRIVNDYLWGGSEEWNWPSDSTYKTIVYYKFPTGAANSKVQWLINDGCSSKDKKGILVIENGDFSTYGTRSGFNGTIVTRNGKFDVTGDYCMNGFVNAQNGFSSSNSSRFNLDDVPPLSELNDSSSAERVGWREVYSAD